MAIRTRIMALGMTLLLSACGGGEVGGSVTGLSADGLSLSNGYETINLLKGATSFAFPTDVEDGKGFAVVVVTQPNGLRCTVSNGSGTVSASTVANSVAVSCVPVWSVSGTLSGLTRDGLVLNNGYEDITVAAPAPSFAFPTALPTGSTYSVTVKTAPNGQSCTVVRGEGVIAEQAAADVAVTCN